MKANILLSRWIICIAVSICFYCDLLHAETIYVNSNLGNDTNPGTKDKPLQTIQKAAELVNNASNPGPAIIEISTGIYCLNKCVMFNNPRQYTQEKRLTIRASVLPDEPNWIPALMPIILSREDSRKPENLSTLTETYSIKVQINHVTIQGLKFLGNPLPNNWHCCIERIGDKLDDLIITQCMFIGDNDGMNIYCATLATGDRFIVDHCIFNGCGTSAVWWDGPNKIGGRNCAMRYCIIDEAYMSGPWTCQTEVDFEFHHNIITRSRYFWMRAPNNRNKYTIRDCIITDNKYKSGYGTAAAISGQTGPEVTFEERNIIWQGNVQLEKAIVTADALSVVRPRGYLHIVPGTFGSDLGAGLFTESVTGARIEERGYRKETYVYKKVDGLEILADVILPAKDEVRPVVLYIHGGGFMFGSRVDRPRKPLLDKLIEANYAVVSIDYRLAPETKLAGICEDARDACIWIKKRGPSLFNADPDRLGVIGGSAGAFLATACGYTVKPQLQAVIAISGFADFEFAKPGTDRSILKQNDLYDCVGNQILTQGGEDRYNLCFFLLDNGLWPWEVFGFEPKSNQKKVNALLPINYIDSDYPATLLIHSKNDSVVPFSQAKRLNQALAAQKIESELFVVPQGHSSEITRNDPEAVEKIVSFLDKYLKH